MWIAWQELNAHIPIRAAWAPWNPRISRNIPRRSMELKAFRSPRPGKLFLKIICRWDVKQSLLAPRQRKSHLWRHGSCSSSSIESGSWLLQWLVPDLTCSGPGPSCWLQWRKDFFFVHLWNMLFCSNNEHNDLYWLIPISICPWLANVCSWAGKQFERDRTKKNAKLQRVEKPQLLRSVISRQVARSIPFYQEPFEFRERAMISRSVPKDLATK